METLFDWHAWQVVAAANIIGAGNGLEVGRNLELLTIRGAEAEAEQALRLGNAAAGHYGMITPGSTTMQVPTCLVYSSACHCPLVNCRYFPLACIPSGPEDQWGSNRQDGMYQTAIQSRLLDQEWVRMLHVLHIHDVHEVKACSEALHMLYCTLLGGQMKVQYHSKTQFPDLLASRSMSLLGRTRTHV